MLHWKRDYNKTPAVVRIIGGSDFDKCPIFKFKPIYCKPHWKSKYYKTPTVVRTMGDRIPAGDLHSKYIFSTDQYPFYCLLAEYLKAPYFQLQASNIFLTYFVLV